ncbi:MAG TPA: SIS domain-containing protein [Noviherbaspirillum sp.]
MMREEACAAAQCVSTHIQANEGRYAELGRLLHVHPPTCAVTIARGSSDHAASYFSYMSAVRGGHVVASLPMSLLTLYGAPIKAQGMFAVAISQSGRSPDLSGPIATFREGGGTTIALVNDVASPLVEAAEWHVPLLAGAERSVAATKSFICSLVAGASLAAAWSRDDELARSMRSLPESLEAACAMDWSAGIEVLEHAERIMVIGRGTGLAIAQEAALKFKETCAIQAEAFSGAEVKHGPMALVDEGYPMLVFAPRGPAQEGLLALAKEMRARGARVLLAAPADVAERELTLATTATPDLDPVAAIQSFYLMVESLALARGRDPDKPKHLSKVTSTL